MSMSTFETIDHEYTDLPVVVLCGGAAVRMASVTQGEVPKHLLTVGNQTVLEHAIQPFMGAGKIVLATGVHSNQIEEFVVSRFASNKVVCSPESQPLGVIGALAQAVTRYELTGTFMIAHGDEITPDFDVMDMYKQHKSTAAELTVLTTRQTPLVKDFAFTIDSHNRAVGLKRGEEAVNDPTASNFGIGTFVCESTALPTMQEHSGWSQFLQTMISQGRLHAYESDVTFYNLNQPADLTTFSTTISSVA
jgi:NDP-sugar pyrophosphorylase family protein